MLRHGKSGLTWRSSRPARRAKPLHNCSTNTRNCTRDTGPIGEGCQGCGIRCAADKPLAVPQRVLVWPNVPSASICAFVFLLVLGFLHYTQRQRIAGTELWQHRRQRHRYWRSSRPSSSPRNVSAFWISRPLLGRLPLRIMRLAQTP